MYDNKSNTLTLEFIKALMTKLLLYTTWFPTVPPYHEYSPVTVSVDAPQLDIGLGSNCGRPRGAVYQGQFAEATSFPDTSHQLIVHIYLSEEQSRSKLNSNVKLLKRYYSDIPKIKREGQTLTSISPWSIT